MDLPLPLYGLKCQIKDAVKKKNFTFVSKEVGRTREKMC